MVDQATKGLRISSEVTPASIAQGQPRIDDDVFSWPLLTLSDEALTHNINTMAQACREHVVLHAPHVKTAMSPQLYARQEAAGAWGPTVANPGQLRTVHAWGVSRIFLANELLDPREARWLRHALEASSDLEVLLYIDSYAGVALLARAFDGASEGVLARLGLLVEVGAQDGRTGTRSVEQSKDVARAAHKAGLKVVGVAGYEGSVARGTEPDALKAVADFCHLLRETAQILLTEGLLAEGNVIVSAGGSAYLDVVLPSLPGALTNPDGSPRTVKAIVRSGAYITHDHGLLERANPWSRMDPPLEPQNAAVVWAQVLSCPEPGLVLCGAGRRDVPYDIDLPTPIKVRRLMADGSLGDAEPLTGLAVTKVDDQHLYLRTDGPQGESNLARLAPGDVIGLGISHPCTLFDKWATALVIDNTERVLELIHTQF